MRTFQFFNQKSTSELEQEFTISNSNDLISTLKGFISFKNLTFKSHDKVYFLSSSFPFLFSFGADSNFISLKVFNLSKLDSSSSSPVLVRSSKLSSAFPVTTCAFNSTLDKLAIGFENGLLILMSGSLTNSRLSSHKTILESQTSISLLHFTPSNHLFCVSFNQILVFSPDLKSSLLDDFGANFNCACGYNDQILVAKPEAIYFYGIDGRGPCSIIQGTLLIYIRRKNSYIHLQAISSRYFQGKEI